MTWTNLYFVDQIRVSNLDFHEKHSHSYLTLRSFCSDIKFLFSLLNQSLVRLTSDAQIIANGLEFKDQISV